MIIPFCNLCTMLLRSQKYKRKKSHNVFIPTEAIVMDMDPFLHCVIPNFIQSQNFLEGLQKELLNLDFHEKYNDLYKFQQVFMPLSFSSSISEIDNLQKLFHTFKLEVLVGLPWRVLALMLLKELIHLTYAHCWLCVTYSNYYMGVFANSCPVRL